MENTISFNTKFGWISATETKGNISRIQFRKEKSKGSSSKNLKLLERNLIAYFQSKKELKISIKMNGNSNQKRIWGELKKIGVGKTKSYGEIAKKLKMSPRYIGRVCAQNKHLIAIPCHRVIRSNGALGGFSAKGGIKLKKKLLEFEKKKLL